MERLVLDLERKERQINESKEGPSVDIKSYSQRRRELLRRYRGFRPVGPGHGLDYCRNFALIIDICI